MAAVAAVAILALAFSCRRPAVTPLDVPLSRGTRLLVIAPHPDDEAIAAAGLIQHAIARGGTVKIVVITSGDGFAEGVEERDRIRNPTASEFRSYGKAREHETVAAMGLLHVPPDRITFLGFPDEGLCLLASRYLTARSRPFESPFTDRATPPASEQVIRGVVYRGTDLARELTRIVGEYDPTVVVVPHPEDEHPDHCAASVFTADAIETAFARRRAPRVLYYVVHFGHWPFDIASALTATLKPPLGFPADEGGWSSLALTPSEAAAKKSAIAAYATQMQVIPRFLEAIARDNELFLERKPLSAECWCDAENVATTVPAGKRRGPRRGAR